MVFDRWSNAQMGYKWDGRDFCVETQLSKKREKKKTLSTSVVHLQRCHLSLFPSIPAHPLLLSNHLGFGHFAAHVDHRRQIGWGVSPGAQRGCRIMRLFLVIKELQLEILFIVG